MLKNLLIASLFASLCPPHLAYADHGFNKIIENNTGRCWRIVNRNFEHKNNADSGIMFKFVTVAGDGLTDDLITYELTIKEDFVDGSGWDESKTRIYTGSGLIKSLSDGRVNFEFYVDQGDGNPPVTVEAFYHPGSTSADSDDRIVVRFPPDLRPQAPNEIDPCGDSLDEGSSL